MKISKQSIGFRFGLVLALAGALTFALSASAAEPGQIELKATASKVVVVVDDAGVERTELVKADLVVPGDKVAYTIEARNVSTNDVEQVVITDPIPEAMLFVPGTVEAEGARVLFSVDGGQSFDEEDKLVVNGDDGRPRPAIASDFTHIRWIFETPLAPETERSVRFVALVE
jgi:uncharacterized repeat protein (TIGR01451 family)